MTDTPKLLSREELDGLLESLRDYAAVSAIRAHIAALEVERKEAYTRGLEDAANDE